MLSPKLLSLKLSYQSGHLGHEFGYAKWFRYDLVHPSSQGSLDLFVPRIGSHSDHRDMLRNPALGLPFSDVADAGQTIHRWHFQIEEDDRKRSGCRTKCRA